MIIQEIANRLTDSLSRIFGIESLAGIAILMILIIAAFYLYNKWRARYD